MTTFFLCVLGIIIADVVYSTAVMYLRNYQRKYMRAGGFKYELFEASEEEVANSITVKPIVIAIS